MSCFSKAVQASGPLRLGMIVAAVTIMPVLILAADAAADRWSELATAHDRDVCVRCRPTGAG